jgi:membrane protease YdiL (CAAX protease family)
LSAGAEDGGPPRSRERIRLGLLVVALVYPTVAAWLYFVAFGQHPQMRWLYLGAKVVQALLPVIAWLALRVEPPRLRAPTPGGRRGVLAGLATGAAMAGAVLLVWASPLAGWSAFEPVAREVWERLEVLHAATPARYLVMAALLSVAHSLFEEVYWRWFALGELSRRLPPGAALAVGSLAFASHHWIVIDSFLAGAHRWTATLPLTLAVAVGGAVWGWLYQRHGALLPAWLSHLIADVAILAVGYQLLWP